MSIENTMKLNLNTYTLDFEIALKCIFQEIFPNAKCIGFYYHYFRNLRDKAREYNLLKEENIENFLNHLYIMPFQYNQNKNYFEKIKNIYKYNGKYIDYLRPKNIRSNSYIEIYNRIIKLKLSKYLYGKNHCRIS